MNEQLIQKRHKASCLWIACGFLFSELNVQAMLDSNDPSVDLRNAPFEFDAPSKPDEQSEPDEDFDKLNEEQVDWAQAERDLESNTLHVYNSFPLSEKVGNDRRRQQFAKDFLNANVEVRSGRKIRKNQELGRGGFGAVYKGALDDFPSDPNTSQTQFIIKQRLPEASESAMNEEFYNSRNLLQAASKQLKRKDLEYGRVLGLGNIVPVIAQTLDGSLIQEMVQGKDLFDTLQGGLGLYNLSGYPNDLQQALELLASFFAGLITIHDCGLVHCDIKPENIMVQNSDRGYSCRIIDLGAMQKIGDPIGAHSHNGGPEYTAKYVERKLLEMQRKALWDELTRINDPIKKEEYNTLNKECNSIIESLKLVTAQPSYDMYSATSVLPGLIFGREGDKLAYQLYYYNPENPSINFKYIRDAQDLNFNADDYFMKKFSHLNEQMRQATTQVDKTRIDKLPPWAELIENKNSPVYRRLMAQMAKKAGEQAGVAYPQPMLKRLARLQARLSSLNPAKRPSAIEAFEEVQGMALAPYWTKIKTGKSTSQVDCFLGIQW